MMREYELDAEEQVILDQLENDEWALVQPQQAELDTLSAKACDHSDSMSIKFHPPQP